MVVLSRTVPWSNGVVQLCDGKAVCSHRVGVVQMSCGRVSFCTVMRRHSAGELSPVRCGLSQVQLRRSVEKLRDALVKSGVE